MILLRSSSIIAVAPSSSVFVLMLSESILDFAVLITVAEVRAIIFRRRTDIIFLRPNQFFLKLNPFFLKPNPFFLKPNQLILKPNQLILKLNYFILKASQLILKPRSFISPKARGVWEIWALATVVRPSRIKACPSYSIFDFNAELCRR